VPRHCDVDGARAAPSTIARKIGVGYATVARIAEATKRLQLAAAICSWALGLPK